jgi:RNA polymerase sigma factor (sigma-70 family)
LWIIVLIFYLSQAGFCTKDGNGKRKTGKMKGEIAMNHEAVPYLDLLKTLTFYISRKTGYPPDDLLSWGYFGLKAGLERYDPAKGELRTYLSHRIKGAMMDGVRDWTWFPRSAKGAFQMELRGFGYRSDFPTGDGISSAQHCIDLELLLERTNLSVREKEIIGFYRKDWNLVEIGQRFGISESRVSQIMKGIVEKLRRKAL